MNDNNFTVKDEGVRKTFASGMQRNEDDTKTKYDLTLDGPMFERWAVHLTKGAEVYQDRNWMQAESNEELARFRRSAMRHFIQWWRGDMDEDHAAAVFFNINGAEYVYNKRSGAKECTVIDHSIHLDDLNRTWPLNPKGDW